MFCLPTVKPSPIADASGDAANDDQIWPKAMDRNAGSNMLSLDEKKPGG